MPPTGSRPHAARDIHIDDHAQSGEVGVRPGRNATAIGAEGEIRSTTLGLEIAHEGGWRNPTPAEAAS